MSGVKRFLVVLGWSLLAQIIANVAGRVLGLSSETGHFLDGFVAAYVFAALWYSHRPLVERR